MQAPNIRIDENRKVLLIGGAGYIGSVLSSYLLLSGYHVRCLDLLLYENASCVVPHLLHKNYEFVCGDFTDQQVINSALEGVDAVVILGGLVGDPITKKYPELSEKFNSSGMRRLIDTLHNYQLSQVIFVSTCSNYGIVEEGVLADETCALSPLSLYAEAKVDIEKYLLSIQDKNSYALTILRFATAFGLSPRMRFDLTINEFVRDLSLGKELLVYDPDTWRPYCHVNDFSRAIQCVLEAPKEKINGQIFNVGSDKNNFTKRMVVEAIKDYIPTAKVIYQEKGSDPRNYRVNFKKIRETLGFEPENQVTDGIIELMSALKQKLFSNVENCPNFYGNYQLNYPL